MKKIRERTRKVLFGSGKNTGITRLKLTDVDESKQVILPGTIFDRSKARGDRAFEFST